MAGHGGAFVVVWHKEDTEEALRAAYRAERDVVLRQRLHALWLLRSSERRMEEVAGLVGATYRTVQRWVAWYREGGLDAIRTHRMGGYGQTPRLTEDQQNPPLRWVAGADAVSGGVGVSSTRPCMFVSIATERELVCHHWSSIRA
jgi:transposase